MKPKNLLTILATIAAIATTGSCSDNTTAELQRDLDRANIAQTLRPKQLYPNPYDITPCDSMPPAGIKLRIRPLANSLPRIFNDPNPTQLTAATINGITPITYNNDIWNLRQPIQRIQSNQYLLIDRLNHSAPYLVPRAAQLLNDIGKAFHDTLQARGGGAYRLKVTSLLRTANSVSHLRRRNINAVQLSTHLFGTSFDISYAKFICDSDTLPRTQADLKNLLAEILDNLRNQGRCYIKYEIRQGCFHITTR